MLDIPHLSRHYQVRTLSDSDVPDILSLCEKNTLYYACCPPPVTSQRIFDDMIALPPGKSASDKYYIGYFEGAKLVAVMDLIAAFPDDQTAWIGFFMTDVSVQGCGIGSGIIAELCCFLADAGLSRIQLGWVQGNAQAERFWLKNRFKKTGVTYDAHSYTVVVAQRLL